MPSIFLALSVLSNIAHNTFLKLSSITDFSSTKKSALFVTALIVGAVNAFFFSKSLEKIPLSIAFPTFAGASIVLTSVVGIWAFSESLSLIKILGSILIVTGIVLLNR